jgi:glycosyltransferase involved in cell wall biosynthesis
MRIGLVTADYWPNVGGVAAHVAELARALVHGGHEVHVATRPLADETSPCGERDGVVIHRPPLPRLRPVGDAVQRAWLRKFVERVRPQLLHVHGLRPLPATRGLSVPVVFTNHTSGFLRRMERGRWARRRVAARLRHTELVLAPSEELAEATLALGLDIPVRYLPNGVDPERFSPGQSAMRRSLGLAADSVVVLLARRLVAKNGVRVLAEAAREFIRPGVKLVFAGDGPEREAVQAILKRDGCLDAALFLGSVPNSQMPDLYRAADISVLPSFLEATSITGLESMACGLPLVGTRVGGIPAIIDDEETGLLTPPGDAPALAAAIRRLCEHPEVRARMGRAGRARIIAEFSWSALAERTAEMYRRVLWCRGEQVGNRRQTAIPATAAPTRRAA